MTGFPMLPYWEFDRWREMGGYNVLLISGVRGSMKKSGSAEVKIFPYDEFWDHMDEINYGEMTVFYCEKRR